MKRSQQNIAYIIILITVMITCWSVLMYDTKFQPKYIYLPQTESSYSPVTSSSIESYTLSNPAIFKLKLDKSPIGIIHVSVHSNNNKSLQFLCDQVTQKAKEISANYGSTMIIGSCSVHKNSRESALDSINFYAYTYH